MLLLIPLPKAARTSGFGVKMVLGHIAPERRTRVALSQARRPKAPALGSGAGSRLADLLGLFLNLEAKVI